MELLPLTPTQATHLGQIRALAESATRSSSGSVVFLTGRSGCGKTHLVRHASESLKEDVPGARVVAGSVVDGRFEPTAPAEENEKASPSLVSLTSKLGDLPIPVLSPALKVLIQILELSAAAREVLSQIQDDEDESKFTSFFEPMVAAAALERPGSPLICLVDDAEGLEADWWLSLQLSFAARIQRELPLVLVLTLSRAESSDANGKNLPGGYAVAKSLATRSLAQINLLPPLNVPEIHDWIGPMSDSLARNLAEASDGCAGDCALLWQDLQQKGLLERGGAGWHLREREKIGLDYASNRLAQRLTKILGASESEKRADELRLLLTCAALEGNAFTAEAVAAACGLDRDETIDLLDQLADAGDDAILSELGFVEIRDYARQGSWHLSRYGFARSLDWRAALNQITDGEEAAIASRLADRLIELYGSETRPLSHQIAALLRRAGRMELAEEYEAVAWLRVSEGVLDAMCRRVSLLETEGWTPYDFRAAAELLLQGCMDLERKRSIPDSIAQARKAEEFARQAGNSGVQTLAFALCSRGRFERFAGDFSAARRSLWEALKLSQHGIQGTRGRAQRELGSVALEATPPDLPAAKGHLEEARTTFGEISSPVGEATCLVLLSDVARLQGDFDSALQYNTEALEIEQSAGRAVSVASALQHRAWIALDMDRPDIAKEAMEELLPFRQERGEPGEMAACLRLFAIAETRMGNPGAARRQLLDSLELERRYGRKGDVAITLTMLGEIEAANGHRLEAQASFEQAETLHQEEGNQAAAAACRRQIEDLS